MNIKQKRRLILCRHLVNFFCYLFYKLRLTRHVMITFCCIQLYLPINLVLRTNLYDIPYIRNIILVKFIYIVITTLSWSYCYNRGKLICNRMGNFILTGSSLIDLFYNFRYNYELKRDIRLEIVRRSGLTKELWYSIEPSIDTNEIYLSVLVRYYIYNFRYEFDKCILKLMVIFSLLYTIVLGSEIRIIDYILVVIFCLVCGYSNLYIIKRLPIDYNNYKGNSFEDFEIYELHRQLHKNKISEVEYNKYLILEKHLGEV